MTLSGDFGGTIRVSVKPTHSNRSQNDRLYVPMQISDSLIVPDSEIEERFVRASGPGGQNVNKVATAVQLRFDVYGSSLPHDIKSRLTTIAGSRMTADGILVLAAREHRTQAQNRQAARDRLAALIEQASRRPKKRQPTKASKASREKRLTSKKKRGELKARRTGKPGAED